jgi:hypothetical protein
MHCCTAGFRTGLRPLGVKTGKAQNERMFSGVPPKADLRELMSTRPSSQVTCSRLLHHDNTKPPQPVTFAVTPQGNTHPQRFRCDGGRGGHLDASGGSLVSSAGLLLCKRPDIGNFTALVTVQSSFVFRSLITVVLCGPSVSKNRDAGVACVVPDGREHVLQSQAGYIDARPHPPAKEPSCDARPDHTLGQFASILASKGRVWL